jgi:hypothetical protein
MSCIELTFPNTSYIRTAIPCDGIHSNFRLLHIAFSPAARLVQHIVSLIPNPLRRWFELGFPEWFLPNIVVIKMEKGWSEEFDIEKIAYDLLKPVQGIRVPKHYGELVCNGTRARLLSVLGGQCIAKPERALLAAAELEPRLFELLTALAEHGVVQDDVKLDNFLVHCNNVQAVDFETVNLNLSELDAAFMVKCLVRHLMDHYREHERCLVFDGYLTLVPQQMETPSNTML